MTETVRVFCTRLSGVYLGRLLESLRENEFAPKVIDSALDFDAESPTWRSVELVCGDGSPTLRIEHYIGGLDDGRVQEESGRFTEKVEALEESLEKREVLIYLRMARELFTLQCPAGARKKMDALIDTCAKVLAEMGEGLIQADGLGFYGKEGMLLELRET